MKIIQYLFYHRVYKAWDFGIYSQTPGSLIIDDYISVENGLGLFPMVVGPGAVRHAWANKFVEVNLLFLPKINHSL